jgi:hypothetical protein
MATRRPIVLVSGVQAELPNNDGIYAASITSNLLEVSSIVGATISGANILGNNANINSLVASSTTGTTANITNITGTTVFGTTVSGNTGSFTSLSGAAVLGNTIQAPLITGTTSISGASVLGSNARFNNVTGTTTVSGTSILGSSAVVSNITGTTTVSGAAILGAIGTFSNITGTTTVSGTSILGSSATISNITGITTVSGTSVLGNSSFFTSTSSASAFIPTGSSVPSNGIYLPATNTVGLASNGTNRLSFGTTDAVFNDTGDNFDLRVEGDTEANLIVVDASADAVGFGTATPAVRCDVAGLIRASTGILFGTDTAANNALDDYEEGTWTPSLAGTTTAGTYTLSGLEARYTKIGNLVTVAARFGFSSITDGTGAGLNLGGLPFNYPATGSTRACHNSITFVNLSSTTFTITGASMGAYVRAASSSAANTLAMYVTQTNGAELRIRPTDITINTVVYLNFSYSV